MRGSKLKNEKKARKCVHMLVMHTSDNLHVSVQVILLKNSLLYSKFPDPSLYERREGGGGKVGLVERKWLCSMIIQCDLPWSSKP